MIDDPALRKAKSTADKCGLFEARDPKWIQRPHLNCGSLSVCHVASRADRPLVEQLVDACAASQHHNRYGILFVLTYAFLLRMPSEALPITAGGEGPCRLCQQGSALVLSQASRKNLPKGSAAHVSVSRMLSGCGCSCAFQGQHCSGAAGVSSHPRHAQFMWSVLICTSMPRGNPCLLESLQAAL